MLSGTGETAKKRRGIFYKLGVSLRVKRETRLSRSRAGTIFIFVMLALLSAFVALPLIYMVLQSLKPIEEFYYFPPRFFVKNPTLENFRAVFRLADNLWVPFSRYLFNSLFTAVVGTAVYVIMSCMAGYVLAKSKIPGRKIISALVVWTLLFRDETTAIVRYIIMSGMGIIDTYWAMLLPSLAGTMGVFLMQQFIEGTIPEETLEAARIDGASEYRILFSIVIPCVKPGWLTVLVFGFQNFWNNSNGGFIYSESLKQLPAALGSIAAGGIARAGAAAAVMVIMLIPSVLVFIYSQRSIMQTMSYSGLK